MKKFTYGFILLLFSFYTYAQSNLKLDSLKKVLAKLPKEGASFAGDTMRMRVLVEMGKIQKDSTTTLTLFTNALQVSNRIKWKQGQASVHNAIGLKYLRDGYNYQAIDKLYLALRIGEELNDEAIIGFSNRYLGACYYALENDKLALMHYQIAIQIFKNKHTHQEVRAHALLLSNSGLSLIRQKKFKESIIYYKEAIKEGEFLKDSLILSWFYSNMGSAYRNNGNIEESINAFNQSLLYIRNQPNKEKAFTLSEKALSLLLLKENKKALAIAKQAIEFGKETTVFENLYIYETLFKAYKQNNDIKNALIAYENWMQLKNANDSELKRKSIQGLQLSYENIKKDAALNQQKNRNNILLGGLIFFVIIGLIVYRNNILLDRKNGEIERQKKEISLINEELNDLNTNLEDKIEKRTEELKTALDDIKEAMTKGQSLERSRVASELHDNLGSIISSIKYRMQAIDTSNLLEKERAIYDSIYLMINDAYSEVRLISHNLLPAELENSGLFGAIKRLIGEINQSEKIQIDLEVKHPNIKFSKKDELEVYSICMELINNTIKHSEAKNACLTFDIINNKSVIKFKDNGIGINLKNMGNGVGMKNIQKRLKDINATMNIESNEKKGTSIQIELAS